MIATIAESDVPVGTNRAIDVRGQSVLIARTTSGIFAIENRCSHAFQTLEGGKMKPFHIFCPLHGARFDLRNGCPSGTITDKPIQTWPATILDGTIMLDMGER